MAKIPKLTVPSKELLNDIDVFMFDCDGVIWKGHSVIEGVPYVLNKLRALGKRIFFITNNSTKSRNGYKKKFDSLGLDVSADEIFSSSFAAAIFLEQIKFKNSGKKAYVIGESGILEELELIDVPYLGGPDDGDKVLSMGSGDKLEYDKNVGAVIVGFDRHINYYKIQYAQLCINKNEGCHFIATNTDSVSPITDAQEWAGGGSMVGAIKGCTGKEPTVVGKPSPLIIDYLCDRLHLQRDRICMVGDRLDTDILFGTDNGLKTVLVLSGVTSEEKLFSKENTIIPDFYADSINDFFIDGSLGFTAT